MKILIAYASKTGTVTECVGWLEKELRGQEITVVDFEQEIPDLAAFDVVILGSSVRYGKIRKSMKTYMESRKTELSKIPHGFFLCCGFGHEFERYVKKNIDGALLESAFAVVNFGGVLKLSNASLMERLILHWIRSDIRESEIDDGEYTPILPGILPENISMMAYQVRRQLLQIKENQDILHKKD